MQQATTLAVDQIGRQATLTIEQTAALLGLGRTAAYEAARRGEFSDAAAGSPSDRPPRLAGS